MLPQDDLTTSEHFRDQRHNKHFALCYNKAMPFAMFATDNWIFIWLALSKLSIIPWVRARENCLIVQLSKAGLGQTHSLHPSHPSPGAENGVHRSLTIPVGPAGHWQFAPLLWADVPLYFSICFFLLESLNSVVKIHNWQAREDRWTERQIYTPSPLQSQGDTAVPLIMPYTNAAPLISCYQDGNSSLSIQHSNLETGGATSETSAKRN